MRAMTIALLLTACGSDSITLPDDPEFIEGNIVAVGSDISFSDDLPTIHVKEQAVDPCGIIFAITDETTLAARDADGDIRDVEIDELTVGTRVRVWTDAVATSCPAQGTADAVELIVVYAA